MLDTTGPDGAVLLIVITATRAFFRCGRRGLPARADRAHLAACFHSSAA
jgi:hypothetical protein